MGLQGGLTPAFTPDFGAAGFGGLRAFAIRRIRAFAGMAGNPENPIIPRIPILARAYWHIALAIV